MDNRLVTYITADVASGQCYFDLSEEDGGNPILRGQAVIYNAISSDITGNGGEIYDIFLPGAFDACLAKNPDIFALWNHNWDCPLGRVSNNRLKLLPSTMGIDTELRPSNTTYSRDVIELVKDGTVRGMSFGAYINKFDWDLSDRTKSYRRISDADIFEVTFTPIPSFKETSAEVIHRSTEEAKHEAERLRAEVEVLRGKREEYSSRLKAAKGRALNARFAAARKKI